MRTPPTFRRDLVWNLASTAIFGVVGLLLYVLVGRFYGPETLGIFSQVIAVYLVLSQIAVGGLVFSVLHFANALESGDEAGPVLGSALVLTAVQASLVCALAWFAAPVVGGWLRSADTGVGIRFILPGLWCFALNKVLFFGLTAVGRLRAHAVAQAARWILLLAALVFLVARGAPGKLLPVIFSLEEAALLLPLLGYTCFAHPLRVTRRWLRRHLDFAFRTSLSAVLLDANTRIDILALGLFASDATVGIYSFAATFAEGVIHIATVVQTNVTPLLGRLEVGRRATAVRTMVRANVLRLCPGLALLALFGSLAFPWFADTLTGQSGFSSGALLFAVLAGGMVIGSSYYPFHYVLNQWGYPTCFMAFNALVVTTNLTLNLALIPLLGPLGAALGTAGSHVLSICYLKALTYRFAGVSI